MATSEEKTWLATPETQPNRRRRKKSIVWEHFTIETVSAGCTRACCKQCKQSFAYSTGSKVSGTSHLKRHIAKGTCPALLRSQGNQLAQCSPSFTGNGNARLSYVTSSMSSVSFDPGRCRCEISSMIILHEYPLNIVEHTEFRSLVQNLRPGFESISFDAIQGECLAAHSREKHRIMKAIQAMPGRISLTLDMWSSCQDLGYVLITGCFIDSDWKIQQWILNVVMEPYPESGVALSNAVMCCLSDWDLENKLFSITYNHLSASKQGLERLRSLLCTSNPLLLNGQLLIGNCFALALRNIAKNAFWTAREIVRKIRNCVKFVKASQLREARFLELKRELDLPSEGSLCLDDQTQWNTTYQMLVTVLECKEVFSYLDTSTPIYKDAPSLEEWNQIEAVCRCLRPIFNAATILTSVPSPAAVACFQEAWRIQAQVAACSSRTGDPLYQSLVKMVQETIEKYWQGCSLVLSTVIVMDPRFKMKLVEFSFLKIYGCDATANIKRVDDGVHELFLEYVSLAFPPIPASQADDEENSRGDTRMSEHQQGFLYSDHELTDFDAYIIKTTSSQTKSELDQYLEEPLFPRVQEMDVLGWWKQNTFKYPILSQMARDILSISVCTATPDSVFNTETRELDRYRSSLQPETLQALVCTKDWLREGSEEFSKHV